MFAAAATKISNINRTHLEKVVLAKKVGQFLSHEQANDERMIVEDVARVLMRDLSSIVRQAMAFELRQSEFVPKDIANQIARDVEDVAAPFMEATEIFSNRELAKLVPVIEEQTRVSIARRLTVPEPVSMAIVKIAGEKAVTHFIRNPGAQLSHKAFGKVVDRFHEQTKMMDQLSSRIDLPLSIVERLVDVVSQDYRVVMVKHYELNVDMAKKTGERASGASFGEFLKTADIARIQSYLRDLKSSGELKPHLILNMTRESNLQFFAIAISELLNLPLKNTMELVQKGGEVGLGKLLRRARFPSSSLEPMMDLVQKMLAEPEQP